MTPQMQHTQSTSSTIPQVDSPSFRQSFFSGFKVSYSRPEQTFSVQAPEATDISEQSSNEKSSSRKSLKRALSSQMSRVGTVLLGQSSPTCESSLESTMAAEVITSPSSATHESSMSLDDVDVAGPRFQTTPDVEPITERTAGDPAVYSNIPVCFFLNASFYQD
jgi:hypothetical protein